MRRKAGSDRNRKAKKRTKKVQKESCGFLFAVSSSSSSSSPRYGRKRRGSSLLFTGTSAVGLGDLAGVGLLEGRVGLRRREVRHGVEGEARLPLILLVVVGVLEAVAHERRWWREGSPRPRPVRWEGWSATRRPDAAPAHAPPDRRRRRREGPCARRLVPPQRRRPLVGWRGEGPRASWTLAVERAVPLGQTRHAVVIGSSWSGWEGGRPRATRRERGWPPTG